MNKLYQMHVISGTHWDREWRHTAEQSKPRLCDLMEQILTTLETNPAYTSFCLDGGLVVLEDYLTIQPENRQRVVKMIEDGRITLVSWYTLPDTFTVTPEAMIRNLQLGGRMAAQLGGAMQSGYTATSYGQTSQLPQIYQGFGIKNAIFYRGTNKHLLEPFFEWEGPDGSRLHVLRTFDEVTRTNWFFYIHQPLVVNKPPADLSYTYDADHIPTHMCGAMLYQRGFRIMREVPDFDRSPAALKQALAGIVNQAKPYAVGRHILALNMEDNDGPFALMPEMIEALNEVTSEIDIRQSTLDEIMQALIDETSGRKLPVHHGELRYTAVEHGFNGLLGATHSSRIKLKILNERAERTLIHHAEPLTTFASLLGQSYPKTYLDRAWRHLLLNQAHDSICGAAVDQAHEDMLYNFSLATAAGEEVTARACFDICGQLNTAADFQPGDVTFTLFNTLPMTRRRVTPLVVDLPKQVCGEGVADPCTGIGAGQQPQYFDMIDSQGRKIAFHILDVQDIQIGVERELDTKGIQMPAVRRRLLVDVEVPALGYRTYALRARGPRYVPHPPPRPDRPLLARENGVLENEHLRVTLQPNGTFDLLHKATGHCMTQQHYFTDNGEIGSAHMTAQPERNFVRTTLGSQAQITLLESNELRGVFRIDLSINVPAGATLDGHDRLAQESTIPISTWLTLTKDAYYLQVKTQIHNDARDHRLRVNFPSHVRTETVAVESAFAVELRNMQWTETGDNFESHYAFQPMQNFVDVSDGKVGLAVLNRGLREYEVKDDAQRTIAITLLRTHRAYMTANSSMTPAELDQYTGLQGFGSQTYELALYPHTGDWQSGRVLQQAYDFKVDFNAIQAVPHTQGDLPSTQSLIAIDTEDLMLAALKRADNGEDVILRLWNSTDRIVTANILVNLPITEAHLCELNETVTRALKLTNNTIQLETGPHKIQTLLLK